MVQVNVQRPGQILGSSVGSGFVFDINGYIITNAHVVRDAEKIIVTFLDGRSYNADLIGSDPSTDIAVIQVKADVTLLHPLPLGDSSKLKVGWAMSAAYCSTRSGKVAMLFPTSPFGSGALSLDHISSSCFNCLLPEQLRACPDRGQRQMPRQ